MEWGNRIVSLIGFILERRLTTGCPDLSSSDLMVFCEVVKVNGQLHVIALQISPNSPLTPPWRYLPIEPLFSSEYNLVQIEIVNTADEIFIGMWFNSFEGGWVGRSLINISIWKLKSFQIPFYRRPSQFWFNYSDKVFIMRKELYLFKILILIHNTNDHVTTSLELSLHNSL